MRFYPVCKYNLLCGRRMGRFRPGLVEEQILRRLASRWRFLRATSIARLGSGLPSEWRLMKTAIATARTTAVQMPSNISFSEIGYSLVGSNCLFSSISYSDGSCIHTFCAIYKYNSFVGF